MACSGNANCANGHCVGGTCCATACDSPSACHVAAGATCGGGTTCVYPAAADSTSCDDGNACTTSDTCQSGTCTGGAAKSCDDGNICTVDTCNPTTGCAHDGTGVVTTGCQAADKCTSYVCDGDAIGSCDPVPLISCDGSTDACNQGVCNPATGACVKQARNDGGICEDGNACTSGEVCSSGVCGGGTAVHCDDGNPCTDDVCDAVLGCKSTNNVATCDDGNPCTVSDKCAGGQCKGTAKDCSAQNDACNTGVCNAGTCGKSPKADNTPCNDNLSCTATDVCTAGACTGHGNACGSNSTGCTEGTPKVCTCTAPFVNSAGQCVPATNECNAAPCVANASCQDPSSAANDYVCTCPSGFSGDGKKTGTGCTNIDDCGGNPCGAGLGTCVDGVNSHTCSCNAGYVEVSGACVCDMNGTFASQITVATSWSNVPFFEDGTNVTTKEWAIRTQTYDSTGHLTIKTEPCGGTSADLCGQNAILGNEAYGQYLPSTIYGLASMPVSTLSITLTKPLQGQPYTEPQSATLLGISLTDPLGAWPAAAANIGAGANQTNGAIWIDADGDSFNGVTTYVVPPGGISHTTAPNPIEDYGANSVACPRASSSSTRLPYAYLPAVDGLSLARVKRLYAAKRTISSLTGTITTCGSTGATLIQGTVGGPDNGQLRTDTRIGGCVRVNGKSEIDCDATVVNTYDGQSQTEHVTSASFVLKRVASTVTCADVRGMTFP